jgi:2,4-dienoyl-CoA reductase-like NADH-dependent reductase (Old Yellow Enzyme family)
MTAPSAVGAEMPITARYGLADSAAGQLQLDEGLTRLGILAARGLNAVEPTYGLMTTYHENIRPYVAVTAARALQDWVFPRLWQRAQPEAYYLPFAKAVKAALDIPVILVGGIRSTGQMTRILLDGDADFLAAARPFIREPDFPQALTVGRQGVLDCVSCNICLKHDGTDALKCWRKNARDLAIHAYQQLRRNGSTH